MTDSSNFLVAEAQLVLEHARRAKAERTKGLGSPIQLAGIALALHVHDGYAWIAENAHVAKKIDLETGKTVKVYRGHAGPVTCLVLCDKVIGSGNRRILITGSWDETIKLWDADTTKLISSTKSHSDFVKALYVFPSLRLLVSSSSDKSVRFWDLSNPLASTPLPAVGSISSHTRPVECLDGVLQSDQAAVLYTADTMGTIKVWDLTLENGPSPRWRSTLRTELGHHRTKINEMMIGHGQLWTASADETVQVVPETSKPTIAKLPKPITHPVSARAILPLSLTVVAEPYLVTGAGDVLRTYDISDLDDPTLLGEVDAHWHDVTCIRLWIRKGSEPWVVTASLDGTLRKWKLSELIDPSTLPKPAEDPPGIPKGPDALTEEEERELAELMDD